MFILLVLGMHAMHEAMILMPQVAPPGPGELRIRIMAVAPSPLDVAGQKVPRESDAAGRNEMLGKPPDFSRLWVLGVLFL